MLTVVFGAGASYDSLPDDLPSTEHRHSARPPLANELFDARFNQWLRWNSLPPIVSYFRHRDPDVSLEQAIDAIAVESAGSATRRRQLAACRFYIHCVIRDVEREWTTRPTNYETLLDELDLQVPPSESIGLISFNYDQLLEQALGRTSKPLVKLDEYVTGRRFKVFKVHGSSHWGRRVSLGGPAPANENAWATSEELIARADEWKLLNQYELIESDWPISRGGARPLVPAISIPMTRKPEFEIPSTHMTAMKAHLKGTSRLVVIGWRGLDRPFIDLLKANLRRPVKLVVVANRNADKVVADLNKAIEVGDSVAVSGGFSNFVTRRLLKRWLETGTV